jgi:hypothetical protein
MVVTDVSSPVEGFLHKEVYLQLYKPWIRGGLGEQIKGLDKSQNLACTTKKNGLRAADHFSEQDS